MHGYGLPFPSTTNETRVYSPVTMSREWPAIGRLALMTIAASLGSIVNGFFVAAFFIEHTLQRLGYAFMACVGLCDILITTGVLPVAATVLLSGQWDTVPVCQALQFLTEAATYAYSMFFALAAAENYYRLCRSTKAYDTFLSMRIGVICLVVFTVSFVMAGVGTYLGLDYDYCQRVHFGNFYFRCTTSIIFHGIPLLLTCYGLFAASVHIRRRAGNKQHYRRSQQYAKDFSMTYLNITAYMMYVLAWAPYIITTHRYPATSDKKFYYCAWVGIGRSLVTSLLYSSLDKTFRHAFVQLFYYCFCKSSLNSTYNNRNRRGIEFRHRARDVRVHIMHQAVYMNPQRATCSIRETQDL